MIRVPLDNVTIRRHCRALYEQHQATPFSTFLDPAETGDIYAGMVMTRTGPDTVALCDGADGDNLPFGLSALERNDEIDELAGLGLNTWAVWVGGPDALFTVDAPAFDTGQAYVVPTDGSRQLLFAGTGAALGKLTSASTTAGAIGELYDVVSANRIIVRLFGPASA